MQILKAVAMGVVAACGIFFARQAQPSHAAALHGSTWRRIFPSRYLHYVFYRPCTAA
jgi:hypothetical protein